jgi:hypothetical protein
MTKQRLSKLFLMACSILVAGGIIWLMYNGIKFIWSTLSAVNPSLAVGIIAAGSTVFVSLATVLISKRLEQKALIKNQQREKKIPIYEELLEFLFKIARASKDGKNMPTEEEITDFMFRFTQTLIIWGSDDVVLAFVKFRDPSQGKHSNILFAVEDIWSAIRKDLGHSNKGISKGMLLRLIINDIDKFI